MGEVGTAYFCSPIAHDWRCNLSESQRRYEARHFRGPNKRKSKDLGWERIDKDWQVRIAGCGLDEILVVRNLWSGRIVVTRQMPRGTCWHAGPAWVEALVMGLIRKAEMVGGPEAVGPRKPASFARDCPVLADYLFDETFANGTKRQRSTLTVMAGDVAGFKAVLNDREEGMSLWATGETVEETLLTMEALLNTQDAPWRRDKPRNIPKKPIR